MPNRALKHLPLSVDSLLTVLFNTKFRIKYFLSAWKHARVFSTLKPGKNPAMPSSAGHDWQAARENPIRQDFLRSKRTWATEKRAVWVQTQTGHCVTAHPPRKKSVQDHWREKANRRGFPRCNYGLRYCMGRRSPLQTNSP